MTTISLFFFFSALTTITMTTMRTSVSSLMWLTARICQLLRLWAKC